jgi:Minichromosome loss protein, Mcl1, middle region
MNSAKDSAKDLVDLSASTIESTRQSSTSKKSIYEAIELSSTNYDRDNRRYLAWNGIGNIVTRILDDGNHRIQIRFTNGNIKQEIIQDSLGFTRASLAYEGAVFSTDVYEEKSNGSLISMIYYHAFSKQTHLNGANEVSNITYNTIMTIILAFLI